MDKIEVEEILKSVLSVEFDEPVFPTKEEWDHLEKYFGCKFCDEFKYFIDFMSVYGFPGDI